MKIITLSNGKRVGNFSSPHGFKFTDGSILPAVSDELSKKLSMGVIENNYNRGDVGVVFNLTEDIEFEMEKWCKLHIRNEVDVVFIPLPMLVEIKKKYSFGDVITWPFRTVRIDDRINKLVSIEKQCV